MIKYIIKRLLWMIPIVLGVAILVFTLMTFCPGDPASIVLGSSATEQDLELQREQMGLNDPYIVRLGRFMSDTFIHFDFGKSWIQDNDPVADYVGAVYHNWNAAWHHRCRQTERLAG